MTNKNYEKRWARGAHETTRKTPKLGLDAKIVLICGVPTQIKTFLW